MVSKLIFVKILKELANRIIKEKNKTLDCYPIFMPRHQKVAGYYVIPSEILSVRPSVCLSVRPSVRQRPPPFLYRQPLLQF